MGFTGLPRSGYLCRPFISSIFNMTISYNWLHDYLPQRIDPQELSLILTGIGLEVESVEKFESVKGSLEGLLIGEVLTVAQHPNADKLRLTTVNVGKEAPLRIVCGAPNVAAGQKVVVAPIGSTIYPTTGEPLTMKKAKIRGEESEGMICAEDEIGLGNSHEGILVLPADATAGTTAADYLKPYTDTIYEIGLTPNRADAASHWGVVRDVCAYLSHHQSKKISPRLPVITPATSNNRLPITVTVADAASCPRYTGVCISGIQVGPSPAWLQHRLQAIGQRPINNIVDITNFIQHETGQPLHAFDYNKIGNHEVVVRKAAASEPFITLDGKERKLTADDLVIADAQKPMCIAGVFGGAESGVTENTTTLFLESAVFDPISIRKTSFRHDLRTDAAGRFEKGVDVSNTLQVLHRAAALITEIAGGEVASEVVDKYTPQPLRQVRLTYAFLKKLSGKYYAPEVAQSILQNLGFNILNKNEESLTVEVPSYKLDVEAPADLVEEIIRIDGLNNIDIPQHITISPAIDHSRNGEALKQKWALMLAGAGWTEMLTNSITHSAYFENAADAVKLINSLSTELDVMRPAMLPTALEVIQFNSNRKQANLFLFEWGKTYTRNEAGAYKEKEHFCLYATGARKGGNWKKENTTTDVYYLKGVVEALLQTVGVSQLEYAPSSQEFLSAGVVGSWKDKPLVQFGEAAVPQRFDIKAPVYFADVDWEAVLKLAQKPIRYQELPRFPAVQRDLALVVDNTTTYAQLQAVIKNLKLSKLQDVRLFDVFKSDKLGAGKQSMAMSFTFQDAEKTLTDKETDGMMHRIIAAFQKEVGAEIRK